MKILVVDDEPDVLLLCRVNLQSEGHEVLEAPDGEAGFERAVSARPDLIVLDVMLPRKDGFTILEMLKAEPTTRDIPVVLLTAKARTEDKIRGWSAGAADYVTKPFSPGSLSDAVRRLMLLTPEEREARRREKLDDLQLTDRSHTAP
ncbi:MAG TPA: response regulator [Actinomycetota bacterium]